MAYGVLHLPWKRQVNRNADIFNDRYFIKSRSEYDSVVCFSKYEAG